MRSDISRDKSILCSTGFGFESILAFNDAEKKAVLSTVGTGLHPIVFFNTIPVGVNNCLGLANPSCKLFTIVVDAFPGEEILANCGAFLYTRPETGSADLNFDGLLTCDEDGNTPDEDPGTNLSTSFAGCMGASATLTNIGTPATTTKVRLGEVEQFPDHGLIPVTINTILSTIDFLEMAITLDAGAQMIMPEVLPGDYVPTAVEGPFAIPNPSNPDVDNYLIIVRFEQLTLQPNADVLFRIRVNEPEYVSGGGLVCPSWAFSRFRLGANSCFEPEQNTSGECVDFGPALPVCADNFRINVYGVPQTLPQGDCKLEVLIGFDWDDPLVDKIPLESFQLELDFEAPNDILLETIEPLGAINCPGSNNPVVCTSSCFAGTGTQTFTVCFAQGAPNEYLELDREPPYLKLTFDAPSGCISGVTLRKAEFKQPGAATCRLETPDPNDPNAPFNPDGFPLCVPFLNSTVQNSNGKPVKDVQISIESVDPLTGDPDNQCNLLLNTDCDGYAACLCSYGVYDVTPDKVDDARNGVSSYDLVLIKRHILGIDPLPAPYMVVAADANNSSTISELDIILLRQIILGSQFDFPQFPGGGWRFAPKNYIFPSPIPPIPGFLESIQDLAIQPNQQPAADFVAIKVGDVNNSHQTGDCPPGPRPDAAVKSYPIVFQQESEQSGQIITLSLTNVGGESLEAFQAGLRFDAERLALIGVAMGDVEGVTPESFGLQKAQQGELRVVWVSPDFESRIWRPGQALCRFAFRVKGDARDNTPLLALDEAILPAETYALDDRAFRPEATVAQAAVSSATSAVWPHGSLSAEIQPNPLTGEARLVVQAVQAEPLRLFLFNAFGVRMGYREFGVSAGRNDILLPETAEWPVGVYSWVLLSGARRLAEGRMVKPQ
ncbi:MAG: hypothetical protein SFV52_05050 [Saprospiraceae bacterium]|nr:hypothetical protein [Saprospiraceae bacterium]